ncbi:MAG: DUF3572 family protein [Janthinobacterium lividum]
MINLLKNKSGNEPQNSSSYQTIFILNVIAFLGESEGMLEALSLESGILPNQLRDDMTHPEVQAGIVDFLLSNESLLIQFCENHRILPAEVWKIRLKLPGAPV